MGTSRLRQANVSPTDRLLIAGVLMGAAVLGVVLPCAHLHALEAAGTFQGTPIPEVKTFVDKLKGSIVWFGITIVGLVVAVIAIMFLAGHSRAHDFAIRTLVGLAILASVGGIVA